MQRIDALLLEKLNKTENIFKGFFNYLDFCREKFNTWDKYCYIPHDYVRNQLKEKCFYKYHDVEPQNIENAASIMTAMYTWRFCKKIYNFDNDLTKMLISQDISGMKMNLSLFKKLPFNGMCLYIHDDEYFKDIIVFICIDNFNNLFIYPLRIKAIIYESENFDNSKVLSCENFRIPLYKDSIDDAIRQSYNKLIKRSKSYKYESYKKFILRIFNLLLYILADNADIERKNTDPCIDSLDCIEYIKDTVETIDVGINIGNSIRSHKDKSESDDTEGKCPHIRCGHWHKYWTGPRGEESKREVIIKWIPPIFVNGYSEDTKKVSMSSIKK